MSQNSCPICCLPCVQCCCPHLLTQEKFSKVKYQTPEKANITVQSQQLSKVPLEKSFEFRQPRTEYSVHPQSSDTDDSVVVSDQPRSDGSRSDKSDKASATESLPKPSTPASLPTLEFSLYYDIQENTLTVHLHQAYNLPLKSTDKVYNSGVKLYLLPNKLEVFESQVVQKSVNPEYDEIFHFTKFSGGPEVLRKQTLVFQVFEFARSSSRDMIGTANVQLADADLYGTITRMEIQPPSETKDIHASKNGSGDILVSLTYKPSQSSIHGIILRLSSLKEGAVSGTRDSYVKVCLYHKHTRQYKWKSSIKKQSVTPVFNEQFQFDVLNMNLENIVLEFTVLDYDRFSRDEVIGIVRVGSTVAEDTCRTHWEEVIGTPDHAVSRWLKIKPASQSHRVVRTRTL